MIKEEVFVKDIVLFAKLCLVWHMTTVIERLITTFHNISKLIHKTSLMNNMLDEGLYSYFFTYILFGTRL